MPYPEELSNSIEETVAQRNADTKLLIDSFKSQLIEACGATRDASGRAALTVLSWIGDRIEGGISSAVAITDQTELIAQSIRFDAHALGESARPKIARLRNSAHQIRDRYAKHVAEREAISPTWNWSVPSEEPRGFGQALKVILEGVVSSDPRLAKEVERYNQTHKSTFAGEVVARSIRVTENTAQGLPVYANDFVSLLMLPGALSAEAWNRLPKPVRVAISAAPAGVAIACGGAVATEPTAQPPTQGVVQEVATAQPATLPETAAPPTTGAEVAAISTPSYSDANGGDYSPEVRSIVEQQSEALTQRLIDGRYVAGKSNLKREYSPEAGVIFAEIVGAPIELFDSAGNLVASYPPGTRVMESHIPGNEGELLFFGPAGVNDSRRAAGLPEIPADQMAFKLTNHAIPYALTLDGLPVGSVMPTSNREVATWIPPELLSVNANIRVIKPVVEGQEWPKGGFDETGQTLLAQMNQGGIWGAAPAEVAATIPAPTPAPQLGESRVNPTTSQQEYFFEEWVTPPLAEGFDAAHIVLENNQIHYRSEGLTQVWSSETKTWVFPEQFYSELGKVVPVSLMGGRLEIADQAAAWQAHITKTLAWLNNPGNAEFLQAVYGKTNIGWEDLRTTDESGQTKYEINLVGLNGEIKWPEVIIISNTGDVRYWTLADYIDDKATFGTKIDVSSPLWIVAGPKNWTEEGVREFVDERLDGPDTFGVPWASHGISFTEEGRLVWIATSTSQSNRTQTQHIPLGGQSGSEVDPNLAEAYLASTIKSLRIITNDSTTTSAIPLYAGTTVGFTDANTSGVNTPEEVDSIFPNPIFRMAR